MICDSLGNPLKFLLSPGYVHDSKKSIDLVTDFKNTALLGDKAYSSSELIDFCKINSISFAVPSKRNAINPRDIDKHQYKNRHLVEILFQRLKVFRKISTRYEKLDKIFLSFIHIGCIFKWLS